MTELTKTMDQTVKAMVNQEGKYLTFSLANEEYGIGILSVKKRLSPWTRRPKANPSFSQLVFRTKQARFA